MDINYEDIGQRIKKIRIQNRMPQEKLAELAGLSTPHMSHIETGSTKLGLPTIIKIANVLAVSVDELLCDNLEKAKPIYENELARIVSDCSTNELRAIIDIAQVTKSALRRASSATGHNAGDS
jgi:transcriptional regulator with XRE-family HTH domain